jgi:AAA domain
VRQSVNGVDLKVVHAGPLENATAQALSASRVDLIQLIETGIPEREYVPGAQGLLPRGKRILVAAERKTGKSLAIGVVAAVDIVLAGGIVVILDRENTSDEYARRLDSVITSRALRDDSVELIRKNFRYHSWPSLNLQWGDDPDAYVAGFGGADVVIFDSSRKFLAGVGLTEDSSDDYAKFTDKLIDPLARQGIATIILDNTGHGDKERARGTSAKEDLVDVIFTLKRSATFNVVQEGLLELECRASRLGEIMGRQTLILGGGKYGSWELKAGGLARKLFHDACLAVLQEKSPLGRNPLINAVRDRGLTGTDDAWRDWLAEFTSDEASLIRHEFKRGYFVDTSASPLSSMPPPTRSPARSPGSDRLGGLA